MIYLDYNATAPVRPSVLAAMQAVQGKPLNASSVHAGGREAKKLLEDARATIAHALGAFPNEVVFVGSGSEANNMVLRAFADKPILVSAIEHASIAKTGALLGAAVVPVDANGVVKLGVLEEMLSALSHSPLAGESNRHSSDSVGGESVEESPHQNREGRFWLPRKEGTGFLVSIMLANNETGVIQPIRQIADIVHQYGGLLHCDAVQALGKIPLDWGMLGADMLTISGHKVGGPVGAAALLIRNDLPIRPLITGGGQELGRRAGTENIPAIVGLARLVEELSSVSEARTFPPSPIGGRGDGGATGTSCHIRPHPNPPPMGEGTQRNGQIESSKYKELIENLKVKIRRVSPDTIFFSEGAETLPNTLQLTMPNVKSETQLMHFDLKGFAVSAGSACSSGRIEPSAVLLAMGVSKDVAETALRVSIGWATTEDEINAFADCWIEAYQRLGKPKAA